MAIPIGKTLRGKCKGWNQVMPDRWFHQWHASHPHQPESLLGDKTICVMWLSDGTDVLLKVFIRFWPKSREYSDNNSTATLDWLQFISLISDVIFSGIESES